MNQILGFFAGLVDIILALVNMLISTIDGIIWLITNIPELVGGLHASFSYMPAFVTPFLTLSLSIMMVLMVIRLL